jgi:hypothetical protein
MVIRYRGISMKLQEERLFKISIDEIRDTLKEQYNVDLTGIEPYLDGNYIVFSLIVDDPLKNNEKKASENSTILENKPKIRKRKRRRNRIRTRNWKVIAQIKNTDGLVANIYEPMVTALEGKAIPKEEQRKIIRQIMVKNRNTPSEESIEYYLNNTLEYIAQKIKPGGESNGRASQ